MPVDGQSILTELLHIAYATREEWRKYGSYVQFIEINIHISKNDFCQALLTVFYIWLCSFVIFNTYIVKCK